jgi:hypothetical protein
MALYHVQAFEIITTRKDFGLGSEGPIEQERQFINCILDFDELLKPERIKGLLEKAYPHKTISNVILTREQ